MCTAQPVDATGQAALMSTGLSDVVHVDEIRFRRDEVEA